MDIKNQSIIVVKAEPEDLNGLAGCENWDSEKTQLTVNAIRTGSLYSVFAQMAAEDRCISSDVITISGIDDDDVLTDKIRMLLRSGIFPWQQFIAAYEKSLSDRRIDFTTT